LNQQLHRRVVLATFRDDDVYKAPARLDKLLMHRTDRFKILLDHRIQRAAPLAYIAPEPANTTNIGVRIHEDFQIEKVAQSRILKDQDSLHDHNGPGIDTSRLLAPHMRGKIIRWLLDRLMAPKGIDVPDQKVEVRSIWMIEVLLSLSSKGRWLLSL
jgi:hypothetical protein